jgi:hypothetical protein
VNQVEWYKKYIYYPIYRFVKHNFHFRWFKWCYEYCTNGFSSRQLWSLDHTYTDFILPRLIAFRKGKGNSHMDGPSGCPILEGYGNDSGSMSEEEHNAMYQEWMDIEEEYNAMYQEWMDILDKMILAFEYHKRDSDDIDFGFIDIYQSGINGINKDNVQWEKGEAEVARRQKIMEEGFSLFAKYYCNLWD